MRKIYLSLMATLAIAGANAQTFTKISTVGGSSFNSGGCTAVVDMNNDGLDDIVILDQSTDLKIAYQQPDGSFSVSNCGTVSSDAQWGMCVGDVDNDGHKDVMCGGYYDDVHIINIDGPGVYSQDDYSWASIFMQGCNLADIDNDGWLDGFACHDDGHSAILHNNGTGTMVNGAAMIDLTFYPEVQGGNDNSGNYGSVWTDFDRDGDIDLFIAKCRQFINDPYDPRRTNILLVNDGNNNYSDEAGARGLINLQQSWTSDFADIDNDGDFDVLLTTHSNTLEIYENDGNGYFTDVTSGSGLEYPGFYLQAKMHDFDNDGFVDLLHAGGNHGYFHNNGDMTFTLVNNTFQNNDVMHSFGIGDLNHDGYLDVYASYGDGYVDPDPSYDDQLFINNGGDNHFVVFDLEGTVSNTDAAGAVVEIHGPWGVQIREVRDGESYGITNTSMCHFGLGGATTITQAIVYWPSGLTTTLENLAVDTWYNIIEGQCSLGASNITAQGGTMLCPGDAVTLQVENTSLSYVWNTGANSSTLEVTSAGNYYVTVTDDQGCSAISQAITVNEAVDSEPTINSASEVMICEGSEIVLTASEGNSYLWSTGEETQSIVVNAGGTYNVQVTICAPMTSGDVVVSVTDSPDAPVVDDVTINQNTTATLTVSNGSTVNWFNSANANTPIASGSSYTTPALSSTTSYWVENTNVYPGENYAGGKDSWTQNDDGQYQNNSNYYLRFDALNDVTINTVKVYASGAGNRNISVVDASGATIASGTFNIPNGESVVTLNFDVPQGSGYGLRCTGNNPQLWRDKDLANNFPYPFNIGGQIVITNTNVAGADSDNYYYYFYDWQIQAADFVCSSERVEVQAIVLSTDEAASNNALSVYPNPANDLLNIRLEGVQAGKIQALILDASGRVVETHPLSASSSNWTLDLGHLAAGIYQLRLEAGDQTMMRKLIIE